MRDELRQNWRAAKDVDMPSMAEWAGSIELPRLDIPNISPISACRWRSCRE